MKPAYKRSSPHNLTSNYAKDERVKRALFAFWRDRDSSGVNVASLASSVLLAIGVLLLAVDYDPPQWKWFFMTCGLSIDVFNELRTGKSMYSFMGLWFYADRDDSLSQYRVGIIINSLLLAMMILAFIFSWR